MKECQKQLFKATAEVEKQKATVCLGEQKVRDYEETIGSMVADTAKGVAAAHQKTTKLKSRKGRRSSIV